MKTKRKRQSVVAIFFARSDRRVGAGAAAGCAARRTEAHADTETNDEKRKARYKETDHVKTYYRVNRYPGSEEAPVLIKTNRTPGTPRLRRGTADHPTRPRSRPPYLPAPLRLAARRPCRARHAAARQCPQGGGGRRRPEERQSPS